MSRNEELLSKDSRKIQRMFGDISHRYDLLNHVLSLNIDRRWRRRTVRKLALQPHEKVLDVCTGTADLALALAGPLDATSGGHVLGVDFCPEMVVIGEEKRQKRGESRVTLMTGDALALPFRDGSFDVATVAFGIRNVCDLEYGLAQLFRVLREGGRLAILEFTTPRSRLLRRLYLSYFNRVLPLIGRVLSGSKRGEEAYQYLPASVAEFPGPSEFSDMLRTAGFESVEYELLTGGIVQLHLAARPVHSNEPKPEVVASEA